MHLGIASLLAALSLAETSSTSQAIPTPKPTASDMYVACFLLVRDSDVVEDSPGQLKPFSALQCGLAGLVAIRDREGRREDVELTFCLPNNSQAAANPTELMAYAYLEWFQENAQSLSTLAPDQDDGRTAFTFAMISTWPCR